MRSRSKIYLLSLGCPRNLVDSEVLSGLLKRNKFILTTDIEKADLFIINTCGFIQEAKEESIQAIIEAAAFKKPGKRLIVTGCLSQRYPSQLKKRVPEIDAIFGTSDFPKIPDYIRGPKHKDTHTSVTKNPAFLYDHKYKRTLFTPKHFAYIKIQEGCINRCSYCVIPDLRGPYRSRDFESILKEVRAFRDASVKEVNIIGQDTTLYGIDNYNTFRLAELLKKTAIIMKKGWVRLLYAHPAHVTNDLIDVIADHGSICKYVDIPVQHINDTILEKMNRRVNKKFIYALINKIRKSIPGVALRTSVMVGFPGETERQFRELVDFIQDMKFEKLGAFTYSKEEGTPAYRMGRHIPEKIKQERFDCILKAQQLISAENNKKLMGKVMKVLIEEKSGKKDGVYTGRTYMDAPEVDGQCYVRSSRELMPGSFVNVRINDTLEYDLAGDAV